MAAEPDAPRRWLILAICCMSLFIVGLDNTIVNVGLPAIRRDLHASFQGLQWTVDGYTLVLASLLLLGGSAGDRLGRARIFRLGLAIFTVASLACSLAPSVNALIACRVLQAVGGCMLNPVAMSIIRNTFEDPRERARAIGVWGGVVGLSMGLGPVLGGALVTIDWRALFLVNVPVGIAAFVLTARHVPESRAAHPRRVDPVGQGLVIVGLATLTYAIIEAPAHGWGAPGIEALFAVAAGSLVALVAYERRRDEPLIELSFFRSVPFSGATVMAVCAFAGLGGFLLINTLYLQEVRGYSALHAGLLTLPMPAMTLFFGPLAGRLVGAHGARVPLALGGVAMLLGSLMLTQLETTTSLAWLLSSYVLLGIGFGLVNPPITNAAVSGMPASQAGVAAAVASTSRQVGQTLGVAVIGAAATARLHGPLREGLPAASHLGWWIMVGCEATVLVVALLSTSRWADGTARRAAAQLTPDDTPGLQRVGA